MAVSQAKKTPILIGLVALWIIGCVLQYRFCCDARFQKNTVHDGVNSTSQVGLHRDNDVNQSNNADTSLASASTRPVVASLPALTVMGLDGFKADGNITFPLNQIEPNAIDDTVTQSFAALPSDLLENNDSTLQITGYYLDSETAPDGVTDIGLARAETVKSWLSTQSFPTDRIVIASEKVTTLAGSDDEHRIATAFALIKQPISAKDTGNQVASTAAVMPTTIEANKQLAEEDAKRQAETEAKRQAEEDAKRQAEEEAKRQAEEEAKRQAEEEAKRQAEEEAKRQAEAKAKRQAEEDAKRQAEAKEMIKNRKMLTAQHAFAIKGEGIHLKHHENFNFIRGDAQPIQPIAEPLAASLTSVVTYLNANPLRQLTVTGRYHTDEQNTTVFGTLGLARANKIREHLVSLGADSRQITLADAIDRQVINDDQNTFFGMADFSVKTLDDKAKQAQRNAMQTLAQTIRVKPLVLYFKTGDAEISLNEQQRAKLADIIRYLNYDNQAKAVITGHTDNVGKRESNITLALERAVFVSEKLKTKGLKSKQMSMQSKGPDQPIADNATAEGRAKNRRVEISISE